MNKELEAVKEFRILVGDYEKKWDKKTYDHFMNNVTIIETAIKNQKRKLDLIGEVLVDVSKGNYADLNIAIAEIIEVLRNE